MRVATTELWVALIVAATALLAAAVPAFLNARLEWRRLVHATRRDDHLRQLDAARDLAAAATLYVDHIRAAFRARKPLAKREPLRRAARRRFAPGSEGRRLRESHRSVSLYEENPVVQDFIQQGNLASQRVFTALAHLQLMSESETLRKALFSFQELDENTFKRISEIFAAGHGLTEEAESLLGEYGERIRRLTETCRTELKKERPSLSRSTLR